MTSLASEFDGWKEMLAYGALAIILGIVAIVWTEMTLKVFVIALGVVVIAIGIASIINRNYGFDTKTGNIAKGVILILLGLVLAIMPEFSADAIAYICAVFFIIIGFTAIFGMVFPLDTGFRAYSLICGMVMVAIGIIICIFPNQTVMVATWVGGLLLLASGIVSVIGALKVRSLINGI
jgi:uncharacterized membrane protein HdeD (DUF308 family)